MMDILRLLLGFFLSNVFGYGGGPSSIPLMYQEIVPHYQWLTATEFSNMLALANSLPGPIATKIAAYTGFQVSGWTGAVAALAATVLPSAAALILLIKLLQKYRQSPVVKGMTLFVQPVIAVMMIQVTWQSSRESLAQIGIVHFALLAAAAYWLMLRRKVHPAFVIAGAFLYGGLFIRL
ncbi:chromate transporter [Paenibacillus aurantius]|uniref:Chromate transporter n=1 Tax=Paenibacillus aurantius TaxID=2918900 RepID=A0AA96LCD2_9BACL|nr:chromate transporter [Paenibacillus aurantius]WNQ10710.1 chromate transporter [Paenibacillus aurantius]